jgi:hypothetical protein
MKHSPAYTYTKGKSNRLYYAIDLFSLPTPMFSHPYYIPSCLPACHFLVYLSLLSTFSSLLHWLFLLVALAFPLSRTSPDPGGRVPLPPPSHWHGGLSSISCFSFTTSSWPCFLIEPIIVTQQGSFFVLWYKHAPKKRKLRRLDQFSFTPPHSASYSSYFLVKNTMLIVA